MIDPARIIGSILVLAVLLSCGGSDEGEGPGDDGVHGNIGSDVSIGDAPGADSAAGVGEQGMPSLCWPCRSDEDCSAGGRAPTRRV